METIQIKTLVDITKPPVNRPGQGSILEQNQYKNWITLQQCIGLRSIIEFDNLPSSEIIDIKGIGFGSRYKGQHRVWTFEFNTDRTLSYDDEKGNIIGLLFEDLNNVPIIEKLTETINIKQAVFDLESPQNKNTIISASFRQL